MLKGQCRLPGQVLGRCDIPGPMKSGGSLALPCAGAPLIACALCCRLSPVFVERVSIRDALGGTDGLQRGGFKSLLDPVELVEPTFQVGSRYLWAGSKIKTWERSTGRHCSEVPAHSAGALLTTVFELSKPTKQPDCRPLPMQTLSPALLLRSCWCCTARRRATPRLAACPS